MRNIILIAALALASITQAQEDGFNEIDNLHFDDSKEMEGIVFIEFETNQDTEYLGVFRVQEIGGNIPYAARSTHPEAFPFTFFCEGDFVVIGSDSDYQRTTVPLYFSVTEDMALEEIVTMQLK